MFGPYGVWGLIVLAITEAIISPVPPDLLLPVLSVGESLTGAALLGVITTLASVLGALMAYYVGRRFSPWVHRRFGGPRMDRVDAWYASYGAWAVLVAAFTPLPFKIFTLSSGVLRLPLYPFLVACLIGRGARFLPEAMLASAYGEQAIEWLDAGGLIALVVLLIALLVGLLVHTRRARARAPGGGPG